MEIIKATELKENEERQAIIEKAKSIVMNSIVEANKEGKRKIRYDSFLLTFYYNNHCIYLEDYPEVQKAFENAGYQFEKEHYDMINGHHIATYLTW